MINTKLFFPKYVKINSDDLKKRNLIHVFIKTNDDVKLSAVYKLNPHSNKWILFFHGNTSYIANHLYIFDDFFDKDHSILMINYRGYGESDKINPTYKNIMYDARAAWDYLINEQKCKPSDITLMGISLGGAIATKLAYKLIIYENTYPEKLIIINSFSSIASMAFDIFELNKDSVWYSIINYFKLLPFNTYEYLQYISDKIKIIIMHSKNDDTIPYKEALKNWSVVKLSPNNKFLTLNGNHNDFEKKRDYYDLL